VLPATGTIGGKLPVSPVPPAPAPAPAPPPSAASLITGLTASPSVLTLNAGGTGLKTSIDFALAKQAQVTVTVGKVQLLNTLAAAGNDHFEWDLGQLPDGRYKVVVTAKAGGLSSTQTADVVIDRTLSGLAATPAAFSPNADGSFDTISFGFALSQNVPVQVTVQRAGAVIATLFAGQLGPGFQTVGWDGTSAGVRLPDGQYTAVVTATDPLATVSLLVPFAIDTVAPVLTVVAGSSLTFQSTELATVAGTINGQAVSAAEPAGTFAFPWTGAPVTSWSLQAKDAAGNASAVVSGP
jgi:flagellar hook assembly protein FlgD